MAAMGQECWRTVTSFVTVISEVNDAVNSDEKRATVKKHLTDGTYEDIFYSGDVGLTPTHKNIIGAAMNELRGKFEYSSESLDNPLFKFQAALYNEFVEIIKDSRCRE